jgi:amino acid adenylation domain-containing protein
MAELQRQYGGQQPLVETYFNFTHMHAFQGLERLKGLDVIETSSFGETSFRLTVDFNLNLETRQVNILLGGKADEISQERLEVLCCYFERALRAMVSDPDGPYEAISLLSPAEREQFLVEWSGVRSDYDRHICVHNLFEAQVQRTPAAPALSCGNEHLTYAELNQRANQLAHYLIQRGVGPEVTVAVCMQRSLEMVVALLGILKAGGAYVPLDPEYPLERLSQMLENSGAAVVLSQEQLTERLPAQLGQVICMDTEAAQIAEQSPSNPTAQIFPDNLAYIIYTSGSTGVPKGVAIQHRSTCAMLDWAIKHYSASQLSKVLASTSICFDISIFELFAPLVAGGAMVLVDNALGLGALDNAGVTLINTVPSAMGELLNMRAVPASVRTVNLAGEVLSSNLVERLYEREHIDQVYNLYGPTEDTTYTSYALMKKDGHEEPSIGSPLSNTRVYLLDQSMHLSPVGVAGELYIAGDGLARGYFMQPELTAERFLPNPFSNTGGERLYRTGDIARWSITGELEFLGRRDQQVKVRGVRIELSEIETVLAHHPAIAQVVVNLQEDMSGDKRLVAYIVAEQGMEPSTSELRSCVREKLPEYMVPATFLRMESFPTTPNGKIDRRALAALEQRPTEIEHKYVAPRDGVEFQVARVMEDVLGVKYPGVEDNFLDLGGHSLLAVRLQTAIESRFGKKIPLSLLFKGGTIERVAGLLREPTQMPSSSPLIEMQPKGKRRPFFCVHAAGGSVFSYMELSRRLGLDQPFYGLQDQSLSVNQATPLAIEEMAAAYIVAMRTIQPEGPYLLGGWSMGGIAAFEMARQLHEQGETVSLLALMDAKAPAVRKQSVDLDQRLLPAGFALNLGLSLEDLALPLNDLFELTVDQQLEYVLGRAKASNMLPASTDSDWLRQLFEVYQKNLQAMQRYVPRGVPVQITLFKASEIMAQDVDHLEVGWKELTTGGVVVCDVPGNHFTMLREPHVRSMAEQLEPLLSNL